MRGLVIEIDDPRREDVRALLEQHLAFLHASTPPEDIHALDIEAPLKPELTFSSARPDGEVLAASHAVGHRASGYRTIQDGLPDDGPVLGIERPETPNDIAGKDQVPACRQD